MTEAKFTKGPWEVERGYPRGLVASVRAKSNKTPVLRFNAFAKPTTQEAEANAHLIAAAPEMYEVLEWLECYAEAQVRRHPDAEDSKNWALVLSALAKARGKQ